MVLWIYWNSAPVGWQRVNHKRCPISEKKTKRGEKIISYHSNCNNQRRVTPGLCRVSVGIVLAVVLGLQSGGGQLWGDYLEITPVAEVEFAGHPGGPFVPAQAVYQLTNTHTEESIDWTAEVGVNWLAAYPANGTLGAGASVNVTVEADPCAYLLPEGNYHDPCALIFTDLFSLEVQRRAVLLQIFTSGKIWVTPEAFEVTLPEGYSANEILTIGNTGDADLQFSFATEVVVSGLESQGPEEVSETDANLMVLEYEFDEPTINRKGSGGYDNIRIAGLESYQRAGAPVVPVRPVKVLVPFGKKVAGTRIIRQDSTELKGGYYLAPGQRPVPLNHQGQVKPVKPNAAIYAQRSAWPGRGRERGRTQSKRGYQFFTMNLFPVQYLPAGGKIRYSRRMRLEIELEDCSSKSVLKSSGKLKKEILLSTDNPGSLDAYNEAAESLTGEGQSLAALSGGPYQYVIITNGALADAEGPWNFQALRDAKLTRGMSTTIVTTEWIYATYDGTRPDGGTDNQTRIRNFLIDAYQNWGTEYMLLGGVNSIVPARMFWVETYAGGDEDTMPVDMYYGCVDPVECSFDYNANGIYGEPNDGVGGGDVDLRAEIYVGRAPVEDEAELTNFIKKTLTYGATQNSYLHRIAMLGEYLGFGGISNFAYNSMEQIRLGGDYDGYFTYGFENHPQTGFIEFITTGCLEGDVYCWPLYDIEGSWSGSTLLGLMNGGVHLFNHLGHANITSCMNLNTTSLASLTNTDYFFAYSQGCNSGWFDASDCFAEELTAGEHGAFAAVMNARFGWGMEESTDGPSQRFNRQFWDAVLGENMLELGRANQDSKEDNLWDIDGEAIRWCYYELNLFGDPAQQLRFAGSCDWIEFTPATGFVSPDDACEVIVRFDASNLTAGVYEAEITVLSNDVNTTAVVVPVTLTVTADPLKIVPDTNCEFNGRAGGEFSPASEEYTLSNTGEGAINFSIDYGDPCDPGNWLMVNSGAGGLDPCQATVVEVSINSERTQFLEAGEYSADITFVNDTTGVAKTRTVTLNIKGQDYFTELFANNDNDLSNTMLTFIPNSSNSGYMVCRQEVTEFPVDPCGATVINLNDDDYVAIDLGEDEIDFYGVSYDKLYVGSNGYVTFQSGDLQYQESLSEHFDLPRIAALFDDLDPEEQGRVSAQMLNHSVVVTFENVPEYQAGNSNNFQIEVFFAGKICITWLGIGARDGLAGLSGGQGLGTNFIESDLSEYDVCGHPGDLDGDGQVDLVDFSKLALYWLESCGVENEWCAGADIVSNSIVDPEDLQEFSWYWLDGI